MILADKIVDERKKNGWSQEELAEQLGVSRQAVSKWESAGAVPDLQRVIQLAQVFGVSTDYLLKDDMGPETLSPVVYRETESPDALRRVSMEEANEYLAMKKQDAAAIAWGVMLCILSPVVLILLAGLSEEGLFRMTEGIATAIGCTVLFCQIAAAVFLFIRCGLRENRFEYLEKTAFETEYGVTGMVREKEKAYEGTFAQGIALGVVLCIVAVVPLVAAGGLGAGDAVLTGLVGVMLALIAAGVRMIVEAAIVKDSYKTLLQEGDYTAAEKKAKSKLKPFAGVYWSVVTAGYLGWSFWTMRWDYTWIVWPVAAVLFGAAAGIARMVSTSKDCV